MADYVPRRQFAAFHARPNRWACIVAHRRAGKTVAAVMEVLTRALASKKNRPQYAYIAPLFVQAKQIAWDYILQYGEKIIRRKNESELYVELINGAKIFVLGADNPDRLRGLYLDGAVLDEVGDMKARLFPEIIRPALADRKGWAVFIGTPKGENAFFDLYELSRTDPEWFSLMLKASTSGILPAEEIEDMKKSMTEAQIDQELECSFSAATQGSIYGRWIEKAKDAGRFKEGIFDPSIPVFTSWDLGYSDDTAIWWFQVAGDELRAIDYYHNSRQDMRHYAEQLYGREIPEDKIEFGANGKVLSYSLGEPIAGIAHRAKYNYADNYVPHDAAYKLLQAGGRSVVDQLYEFGIKTRVIAATTQQNQIAAGRSAIDRAWFDPVLCKEGIRCLRQYSFKEGAGENGETGTPKHDIYSHGADAWEGLARVWKSAKIEAPPLRPKFLNEMTVEEIFYGETTQTGANRI